MLLETSSTTELINLKLATEKEDLVYIPQSVRNPRLVTRLDEFLGLPKGTIDPCPASLPFNDDDYVSKHFVDIERQHKVSVLLYIINPIRRKL